MLSKKTKAKVGIGVLLISSCLIINHHKQQMKKIRYQEYINQEFDKTMKENQKKIEEQFIKPLEEKRKREELKRIEDQRNAEKRKQEEKSSSSMDKNIKESTFILTFYSSQNSENGYGPITCEGKKLMDGMAANNILPLGTRIFLKGYGEITIADRGGTNFNTIERLDVFVPREKKSNGRWENDEEYSRRVNNMGKVKVKGYIIK